MFIAYSIHFSIPFCSAVPPQIPVTVSPAREYRIKTTVGKNERERESGKEPVEPVDEEENKSWHPGNLVLYCSGIVVPICIFVSC